MPEDAAYSFIVPLTCEGVGIRDFLRDYLPLEPPEFIRALVADGVVQVNGTRCSLRRKLAAGDAVAVPKLDDLRAGFKTRTIPASVLYEDAHILVLDKPAGCTVVRRRNQQHCAFQNGVLDYLRRSPDAFSTAMRDHYRPRALNRLDQDTTGAMLEAKTRAGELHVAAQIQARSARKEYLAVVRGEVSDDGGTIEEPIGPVPGDISRMAVGARSGKHALTEYAVVERFRGFTLARAILHTGRRHQIRLHFAQIGHPVLADALYGGGEAFRLSSVKRGYRHHEGREERPLLARSALHAASIAFVPVGAEAPIRVEAPLPGDMSVLLKQLRRWAAK